MANVVKGNVINEVSKRNKNGEAGIMFVLDVSFPEKHPLAGKPVCKWYPADGLDLMKTSKKGWSVEFTEDGAYVNKPLIDFFDVRDYEIQKLAEVGLSPQF